MLVAIKAPKPDAPPVTIAVLSFSEERSKVFDRSATGVMVALNRKRKEKKRMMLSINRRRKAYLTGLGLALH